MPNFEKYNLSQVKTERFYQLPKYLFEDAYFKKMSAEAKIMYALLKDRFELSIQNEWVDKNNNIYFIFSNKHLCEYLGYAEQKIIKLKKELISFNLLIQERVGLNKPNRLYLLKPNYDIKASHSKELPNYSINTYYLLEDMEIEILHVLKRFKAMLIQKNETVEAMQGYLMKSLKSEFAEMHTLNKRRDNLPITSLFNQ